MDRSALAQKPTRNPRVEQLFGRRTDFDPVATGLSPRLGFSYRLNEPGTAPRSLNGGIGVFAGRKPASIFSAAARQTGLPNAEQRLICIGSAVPIPDWNRYIADPESAPDACADGAPGVPHAQSSRAPAVTVIAPDQSMPSSIRFDIGYLTRLPKQFTGKFRYTYSLGTGLGLSRHQPGQGSILHARRRRPPVLRRPHRNRSGDRCSFPRLVATVFNSATCSRWSRTAGRRAIS